MKKTYRGSCHCGAVRLEADIDLAAGTFKCNCPICAKTRNWGIFVRPDDFRLLAGEAELADYRPYNVHHKFCQRCGVRLFGMQAEAGVSKGYAVRVSCLDDVDINELLKAPVTFFDGLHDNYETPPAETRHL